MHKFCIGCLLIGLTIGFFGLASAIWPLPNSVFLPESAPVAFEEASATSEMAPLPPLPVVAETSKTVVEEVAESEPWLVAGDAKVQEVDDTIFARLMAEKSAAQLAKGEEEYQKMAAVEEEKFSKSRHKKPLSRLRELIAVRKAKKG